MEKYRVSPFCVKIDYLLIGLIVFDVILAVLGSAPLFYIPAVFSLIFIVLPPTGIVNQLRNRYSR